MTKNIEAQMNNMGYVKVEGLAILNDVAVTETQKEILSPELSTQQSVDVFNDGLSGYWDLYRKKV